MTEQQKNVLAILQDSTKTHEQTMMALAKAGENLLDTPGVSSEYDEMKAKGLICDLNEGHAPYSPRYILPDYAKFMREGSAFLRLTPPTDLLDATTKLLIFYHHVPSVTHFPVFIGRLDELLEPFVEQESPDFAKKVLKGFLLQIDRTITDSFCHGNIGPKDSKTARILLECMRELQDSTPNMTLRYDPDVTPDDFAVECVRTALDCANPSFGSHPMFLSEFGPEYGIASCYNGLPIAGGAFTLTRLILARIADGASSLDNFFAEQLPHAIEVMCAFMDAKIRFLVEETPFFSSNFLVKEGFINKERFNGLFGMVGLCECVNRLMALEGKSFRFGHDPQADQLGVRIMDFILAKVNAHENPYCPFWNHHFMLHAQVGIETDFGISPGTRIAIGEEIPL
ncbi:MAG: YjjI family glycine radical enzyme, partial [Oscillospiraceae bacterium]